MRFSLEEIATICGGEILDADPSLEVEGAQIDSRSPRPGALFVPLEAARDGHAYVGAALEGGSAATFWRRGHALELMPSPCPRVEVDDPLAALQALARAARRRLRGEVIAICGSNGKTSTRAMVQAVVEAASAAEVGAPPVASTAGNFNNHIGLPLSLLDAPQGARHGVFELGMSAPGENAALAEIVAPTIVIVTSVALEHLEFMGTIEAIADAEAEPLSYLPSAAQGGLALLPSDEGLLHARMPAGPAAAQRQLFGPASPAGEVAAEILDVEVGPPTHCRIRVEGLGEIACELQLFGAHNARNAAAGAAVGARLGLSADAIKSAIESVQPVGDRGRVRPLGLWTLIADCYNSNPGSAEVALRSLAQSEARPRIAVLGDMLELGPTSEDLHAGVGRLAAELGIEALVGVGPMSAATVRAASAAGVDSRHFESPAAAAPYLAQLAGDGPAMLLFKGSRGMRMEEAIASLEQLISEA